MRWVGWLLVLSGCATPVAQLKRDLGPRAAADLSCDEGQLAFVPLEYFFVTTRVEVTGCGQKKSYQFVESRWERLRLPGP
jgi:hypothetical protein